MGIRLVESPSWIYRPFSSPRREFERDDNGFVKLDDYHPYLVDEPDATPLIIDKNINSESWKYQHIYFQNYFYKQQYIAGWQRDYVLYNFCESPYNQIAMRYDLEEQLHRDHEEHVFAPPPENMARALIDFEKLDMLGGAIVGRRVALAPEARAYLVPGSGNGVPKKLLDISPTELGDLFDQKTELMLEQLKEPLIIPEIVVTSAIKRMSRLSNNELLIEEARRRLADDSLYYPLRLRAAQLYYDKSREIQKQYTQDEDLHPGLQTERSSLELVA